MGMRAIFAAVQETRQVVAFYVQSAYTCEAQDEICSHECASCDFMYVEWDKSQNTR